MKYMRFHEFYPNDIHSLKTTSFPFRLSASDHRWSMVELDRMVGVQRSMRRGSPDPKPQLQQPSTSERGTRLRWQRSGLEAVQFGAVRR